jgi:hypothetical protein
MSLCLAYPQYDSLGEFRFLSPDRTLKSLEIVDREDLVMDPFVQLQGIFPASSVSLSQPGIHLFKDSFPFPFQPFSFEQKSSILRC